MKIHDQSAQHIFPNKWYTTYECILELVVTVPSARSTIVKKIKRFIIWLYNWSRVTFTEFLSAVLKIPWQYHHFPWLFHDFPWPMLFSMTFQAWKMVLLNSTTFHDQGAPWCAHEGRLWSQLSLQRRSARPFKKENLVLTGVRYFTDQMSFLWITRLVHSPWCLLCILPSLFWSCWLGNRKGIRPIKNVGCWFVRGDDLTGAYRTASFILSFNKIQNGDFLVSE